MVFFDVAVGCEVTAVQRSSFSDVDDFRNLTVTKVTKTSIITSDGRRWTKSGKSWGADVWRHSDYLVLREEGLQREADQAEARVEQERWRKYRGFVDRLNRTAVLDALPVARDLVVFLEGIAA